RDRAVRNAHSCLGRLREGVRPRERYRLGVAAELLDPPLDPVAVPLCLAAVLLEALTIVRLGGEPDVRLQRLLELPLFAVRLVQVLDQFGVTSIQVRHV